MKRGEGGIQEELEHFLDRIVEQNVESRRRQEERQAGDNAFLEAFRQIREAAIEPTMNKACKPFEARQLPSSVHMTDNPNASSISLTLAPEAWRHAHLTYATAVGERRVRARRSVSHHSDGEVRLHADDTPIGEFLLEEVTADLVQDQIENLLQDMIR